jgi:ribonuclease E
MTKRMFINAIHSEECRIAVAEDDKLIELEVERADSVQLRGNIYKATITRIEPSLQAAFLDIGAQRNGFLQINDIHPAYFKNWSRNSRPAIQDVLSAGQSLAVQVVKDEREAKGATLTTNLSLPGRFLVLMIGNQRGGVSRKIADEIERRKLRQSVDNLKIPAGMGVIVRTAGISRNTSELQRDLDGLLELWYDILEKSQSNKTPVTLYKESDLALRTIRDYLSPEIDEVLIDDKDTYERSVQFVETMMPTIRDRIKFFDNHHPLFSYYHLDKQVETTTKHEVTLPSGGSIIISVTEAIVAIDVNSGRATSQADVEETAFATNLEAAKTIAIQLRLRDLGGLIVVDFIDMYDRRHKQGVEKAFRDALRSDRAKVEIGRISKFGLLELSRQRLRSSLVSQSHITCPSCSGRGRVKTADSAALEALRKIQSTAFSGGVETVRIRMAPAAALFLLNNKRHALTDLEDETKVKILVYADGRMKPEEYQLELDTGSRVESQPSDYTTTRSQTKRPPYNQQKGTDRRTGGRQNPSSGRSTRGHRNNNQRTDNKRPHKGQRKGNRYNPRNNRKQANLNQPSSSTIEQPNLATHGDVEKEVNVDFIEKPNE